MSTQDRCTVCAEHTIGLEIILGAPMLLLRDVGHVETCFDATGDSFNLDPRKVHGLR
jgi:hypothetical protein